MKIFLFLLLIMILNIERASTILGENFNLKFEVLNPIGFRVTIPGKKKPLNYF